MTHQTVKYVKLINDDKAYKVSQIAVNNGVCTYELEVPSYEDDKVYITVTANFVEKVFPSEQAMIDGMMQALDSITSCPREVKYVKLIDSPGVLEVHGIDPNLEGDGTAYMLECEKGMIEPFGESLVEKKFYNYAEVRAYIEKEEVEEEIRLQDEEEAQMEEQG